jgi:hypothetical protein
LLRCARNDSFGSEKNAWVLLVLLVRFVPVITAAIFRNELCAVILVVP